MIHAPDSFTECRCNPAAAGMQIFISNLEKKDIVCRGTER